MAERVGKLCAIVEARRGGEHAAAVAARQQRAAVAMDEGGARHAPLVRPHR